MASFGVAIGVAVVFLVLGCYLALGPYTSDRDYNMEPGELEVWSLPSWFYFVLPVEVTVAWTGMVGSSDVSVYACSGVSNGACTGSGTLLASGNGSSGSLQFQASEGEFYAIGAESTGIVTVTASFSSIYGAIVFLVFVAAVACIGVGLMRYSIRDRYAAI